MKLASSTISQPITDTRIWSGPSPIPLPPVPHPAIDGGPPPEAPPLAPLPPPPLAKLLLLLHPILGLLLFDDDEDDEDDEMVESASPLEALAIIVPLIFQRMSFRFVLCLFCFVILYVFLYI